MAHPLDEAAARTQALQHLREVWNITNDPDAPFGKKVSRLFELETGHLDLPYGFVSHIDVATDTQTIEHARGDHELLQPGQTCPLSESYCRKTIQEPDGAFCVDDAHADGFGTDPAYHRFELDTYIGATIEFDGETYGTFCFASSDRREEQLTDGERMLIDMLATWASNALQHQRTRAQLMESIEQAEELAGIALHDIRNPLAIAQGHLDLLEQTVQESVSKIDRAHERMDTLIDDILTLTRVNEPVERPSAVPLKQCVTDCWEHVQTGEATLTAEFDEKVVYADEPRLKRLFENLFRNARDHGDGSVSVEVGVTEAGFYVADDGPGIPADERESVFQAGYSGEVENTGFGLSIVRQIVAAHGWEIAVADSVTGGARFDITGVEFTAE